MTWATLIVVSLTFAVAAETGAQNWASKVFKVRNHDFGNVARNAKAEFLFEIENPYATDLHIAGVRASCGCTTPKILKSNITTYETGGIQAVYNTDRFQGRRNATLTVTFDRPKFAEVQLTVKGNIRGDVAINPGVITFGSVDYGQTSEKKAQVRYRGVQAWNLVDLYGKNDYFDLELIPLGTNSNVFDIVARLKPDAPFGFFNEQVTLVTSDPNASQFSLQVEGRIVPPVSISPAALYLGVIQPNQTISKKIVVRGKQPFRIVSINPNDERFAYELSDEVKAIHIVPISFTAGDKRAKVVETIEVLTDIGEGVTATCQAAAAVMKSVASK